jgi:cell wall-associated NlpC family hydrolase
MRARLLIPLAGAVALAALCAGVVSATPEPAPPPAPAPTTPAINAKKAEAARVLEEIAAIDEQLNATSEQYDGARLRLQALRKTLASEEVQLTAAKARYKLAQLRAARFVVWLYTSNHASSLDVILGARTLGQLIQLSDAENAIGRQATMITEQTASAKTSLEAKVRQLARDRAAATATVRELARQRASILQGLAQRRTLLASVESEVRRLEAAERARQARLAAEARAELAAELAARARAEAAAEAAARRHAAAQARAAARAKARAAAAATTTGAQTTTTAVTTDVATATTTATTVTSPTTTTTTTTTTPAAATTPNAINPPAAIPPSTAPVATTPAALPPTPGTSAPTPGGSAPTPVIPPSPVIPTADLPAGHPQAAQIALQYLGVPYKWGGATPTTGFDCSGLVTYVFAQLGVFLPHFAAAQWDFGVPVTVAQLQAGDLVFFDALDHVGIYLGNNEFINAPHTGSWVRIDTLDEPWYAKHYVGARRI